MSRNRRATAGLSCVAAATWLSVSSGVPGPKARSTAIPRASELASSPPTVTTRKVTAAVTVGTVIEWYDFFLYGTAAALIFPKLFFPAGDPATSALLSFATFATGFAARPLGGFLFGHLGDRFGRKTVLIATLVLMAVATVGVGLLPTYSQIGVAAPILLVILRVVQGLGTGGEWGGAALMTKENGSRRPGFFGSFLSSAVSPASSSARSSTPDCPRS
ncbi:MFS transporter [Pseudonocardia sp. N23]|uniref:MFS transporter n=1 Tax=Pseudonocardia sp. N23 TaxID=1987376 RepID=UPI000BFCC8B0|nr:MFS transporter [Pseudonocardia sp. N23]GAY08118.1 transporter, MFS superfamily [Pseudonocardia sp. N23]